MKQLTLIRHAQAIDKSENIDDHDRLLTPKGIKQSKELPKILKKLDIKPQYLMSSTAVRCIETAKKLCDKFDLILHTDESLYFQGIDAYMEVMRNVSEDIQYLAIVGHNDDMTELIITLLDNDFPSVAKGSATVIEFDIDSWSQISNITGKLKYYITC